MGGRASRNQIMSNLRKSNYPKFRIGDGLNSVPVESKYTLLSFRFNLLDGIRAFFPNMKQPGAYRRMRSKITRRMNKPFGYK